MKLVSNLEYFFNTLNKIKAKVSTVIKKILLLKNYILTEIDFENEVRLANNQESYRSSSIRVSWGNSLSAFKVSSGSMDVSFKEKNSKCFDNFQEKRLTSLRGKLVITLNSSGEKPFAVAKLSKICNENYWVLKINFHYFQSHLKLSIDSESSLHEIIRWFAESYLCDILTTLVWFWGQWILSLQ